MYSLINAYASVVWEIYINLLKWQLSEGKSTFENLLLHTGLLCLRTLALSSLFGFSSGNLFLSCSFPFPCALSSQQSATWVLLCLFFTVTLSCPGLLYCLLKLLRSSSARPFSWFPGSHGKKSEERISSLLTWSGAKCYYLHAWHYRNSCLWRRAIGFTHPCDKRPASMLSHTTLSHYPYTERNPLQFCDFSQ